MVFETVLQLISQVSSCRLLFMHKKKCLLTNILLLLLWHGADTHIAPALVAANLMTAHVASCHRPVADLHSVDLLSELDTSRKV